MTRGTPYRRTAPPPQLRLGIADTVDDDSAGDGWGADDWSDTAGDDGALPFDRASFTKPAYLQPRQPPSDREATGRPLGAGLNAEARARSGWYRRRDVVSVNPRRSRIIRYLRVVVPSLAAVLLIGTLIWPLLNAGSDQLRRIGKGESAMLNARFEGYDSADRLVSITADKVVRSQGQQHLVDLQQPLADVTFDDGSKVAIRANAGRYDEVSQQLLLDGDVNMFQPDGFEFVTRRLQLDTASRTAWSDTPVTGTGPGGRIAGSAVRIIDNGRVLVFPGKGKLILDNLAGPKGKS